MHTCLQRVAVLIGLGASVCAMAGRVTAQSALPDSISIPIVNAPQRETATACLRAIPDSVGMPVTAYVGVPANDSVAPALREQIDNFAAALDDDMRHALTARGDEIPFVRTREGGFEAASVTLLVRRDGSFDWMTTDTARSSRMTRQLLIDALEASRKRGEMIVWPDGVPGDSARVRVHIAIPSLVKGKLTGDEALPVALPVFTTRILDVKPVAVRNAVTPKYPEDNRRTGWMGAVHMQFVVDQTGHAVDSTIKTFLPKGAPPLAADQQRVYDTFVAAVKAAIPQSTYYPAEVGGCKVKQVVQQEFIFDLRH